MACGMRLQPQRTDQRRRQPTAKLDVALGLKVDLIRRPQLWVSGYQVRGVDKRVRAALVSESLVERVYRLLAAVYLHSKGWCRSPSATARAPLARTAA